MIALQALRSPQADTIELTAIVDTALCVGAGGSSGSLADKPIVRTGANQLLIPASQLKGRLRHECEKLARSLDWPICRSPNPQMMCPQRAGLSENFVIEPYRVTGYAGYHCLICQIFGNPALRSRLWVDDLVCVADPAAIAEVLRPGVTLSRRRRTAEEKKLYLLETSPVNAQLEFVGTMHLQPDCPTQAKALLLAALHHIHALGGSKSGGLGWLHWKIAHQSESLDWQILPPGGES
jgi:CRISPR/Cas system CSM-associated protein Csm3 (group 7 of RAMP superfamily)